MKIIATVITSLLLSLGLLVSPVSATPATSADPTEGLSCEDARAWWMDEALESHAELETYHDVWVATKARADRLERVAERRRVKIIELRKTIRDLRGDR